MATATLTGGVITDAVRATGVEGDGRSNDSSVGVWPETTNDHPNGAFAIGTTGWTVQLGALTPTPDYPRLGGGWAGLVTPDETGAGVIHYDVPVPAAGVRTASIHVYAEGDAVGVPGDLFGPKLQLLLYEVGGASGPAEVARIYDAVYGTGGSQLAAGWNTFHVTGSVVNADRTHVRFQVQMTNMPAGSHFVVTGCNLERRATATPYVHTAGAAASRAAGRVQVPALGLSARRGWAALRARPSLGDTDAQDGVLWRWADDADNGLRLRLVADGDDAEVVFERTAGGVTEEARLPVIFLAGDELTVIAFWSEAGAWLSVNGGPLYNRVAEELADDFERADTTEGLGTATTGQTYWYQGLGLAKITSGRYVAKVRPSAGGIYPAVDLSDKPTRQRVFVSFDGAYQAFAAIALPAALNDTPRDANMTYKHGMSHPVFATGNWNLTFYPNASNPNVEFEAGMSGFWPDVAGATVLDEDPASPTYERYVLKTDGTVYEFGVDYDWRASTIRLRTWQGDTLVMDRRLTDPRVAALGGRYTVYQVVGTRTAPGDADTRVGSLSVLVPTATPGSNAGTIPTIAATTADIGSNGTDGWLAGDVLWYAAGRGALDDTDCAAIAALGNADPSARAMPRRSVLRYLWQAEASTVRAFKRRVIRPSEGGMLFP